MRILKYGLEVTDSQFVEIPKSAEILSVHTQRGLPCLWVQVPDSDDTSNRKISMFGTGHYLPDTPMKFIGTFLISGDSLVFHVFEVL